MAYTIPHAADVGVTVLHLSQTDIDKVDFDILQSGIQGDGVSSGCAVTAQGTPDTTVAVASGTTVVGTVSSVVSAGNLTMTAAHGTNPRFDLITVNNVGTKAYTAGTAAASPVFPAIPANSVVLAAIYVPANDNIINATQIVDKRVTVDSPLTGAGWTTVSKAADQAKTADVTLANDSALVFTMAANTKYRIRARIHVSTANGTPDFKSRLTGPASPTLMLMHWRNPNAASGLESAARMEAVYSATDYLLAGTAAFENVIYIDGYVHNGANAGTFAFQWAQNVSDAGATTVRAGSYLEYAVS